MERGRGRHRRGGGGRRPYRGRGSGGDREHAYRGHRGPAREQTGTPGAEKQGADDSAETPEVSEERTSGFSRRKIVSNWERYEAAEKAADSEVVKRGEEYSVLLSSAGDSYAQFRLSEEKEWGSGTGVSPVCVDYTALLTALQALPLHLTLNIEEDIVQEGLPQELPHPTPNTGHKAAPTMGTQAPSSGATPSYQPSSGAEPSNHPPPLDQELDFLLGLEAPVVEGTAESHVWDLEPEEPEIPTMTPDLCLAEKEVAKAVTDDDLEDWLDAMIA